MQQTNGITEKIKSNRTRVRLGYGEVDERRQRNDKLNKPRRVIVGMEPDGYTPRNLKQAAERRRALHHQSALYMPDY